MNYLLTISLFLFLSVSAAGEKAVYGRDDRREYGNVSERIQLLADATAGMIKFSSLEEGESSYKFPSKTLGQQIMGNQFRNGYLCSDEKYYSQEIITSCTGFLVSKDTLLTAGHCITGERSCKANVWSFGLNLEKVRALEVAKRDIYKCKRIIERGMTPSDYALIQLDREVVNITPLKLATKKIRMGESVFSIGHPSGLPLKVSTSGKVEGISKSSFKTNLDTFAGNSGSPVISAQSYEVVGILVRGALDYVKDLSRGCFVTNSCQSVGSGMDCQGESVTPIKNLLNQ